MADKWISGLAVGGLTVLITACTAPPEPATTDPDGAVTSATVDASMTRAGDEAPGIDVAALQKPGFVVELDDGRIWVRRPGQQKSDRHVTWVGAGPSGLTMKAPDADTALAYVATRPGFEVEIEDGRIWVLNRQQPSEKCVTRVGAGPRGTTVKANDLETLDAYAAAPATSAERHGFEVEVEDGRLWVRRPGQQKSDKHVTWVSAGPGGMTVKAPDAETALAYLATRPGFDVEIEDGRVFVLRRQQKTEKHVTRVGAGPRGATLKAVDVATLDAYLGY